MAFSTNDSKVKDILKNPAAAAEILDESLAPARPRTRR